MNLKELCIRVIVDKFDRYNSAFSKSDDKSLKRNLEFLQRVYSFRILSQLSNSEMLRTEYIDFLVNKYLKILDTDWLRDCPWKTVAAKFAEVGPNLRKVYFWKFNKELTPWQNVIPHLTSLEVFSFPYACTDEILKTVTKSCPNIVEIDISYSKVTNKGITYLCMKENGKPLCTKLKKVFINSFHSLDEGVKYLIQNLRSLEVTDYDNLPQVLYTIHQKDLLSLNKIEPYNLTTLNLLPNYGVIQRHYTSVLKVCLSLCPFLKSLSCPVSNMEHLALFSNPLELEELHLKCFSSTEIDVTDLLGAKGQNLTSLTVTMGSLSVTDLSDSCPSLKQLYLNDVTFKSDDNIAPSFKCLETCFFSLYRCDSAAAESVSLLLKYSPKLEHIGFPKCDLSSSELRTAILKCCECCPIKKVNFAGSVLDNNFIKDILISCRSLKKFRLEERMIDSDEEYGFDFDYYDDYDADGDSYCYDYDIMHCTFNYRNFHCII